MKTAVLLLGFGLIGSAAKVINFDNATVGKTPPGWTVTMTNTGGAPKWEIRRDHTAPTQPYVLAQLSSDAGGNRCPMAILDNVSLRDIDLSVRIKPVSGKADQVGGLVWRYRDPNNYYLVRANALSKDVALFKVENGHRTGMNHAVPHNIPSGGWSILKVSVRGDKFQVYVNHRRILEASDATFEAAGSVGVWTEGDAVTYFDDFRIYPK